MAFNIFVRYEPGLRVGINHSKHLNGTAPKDCIIANNLFLMGDSDRPFVADETRTVELVQGDELENWVWEGNVTDGPLGMSARVGITHDDVGMMGQVNGLTVPAKPRLLEGSYTEISRDAVGRRREWQKMVGCLESIQPSEGAGPLRIEGVGPEAWLER